MKSHYSTGRNNHSPPNNHSPCVGDSWHGAFDAFNCIVLKSKWVWVAERKNSVRRSRFSAVVKESGKANSKGMSEEAEVPIVCRLSPPSVEKERANVSSIGEKDGAVFEMRSAASEKTRCCKRCRTSVPKERLKGASIVSSTTKTGMLLRVSSPIDKVGRMAGRAFTQPSAVRMKRVSVNASTPHVSASDWEMRVW